jgi:hypothetical protein
MFFDFSILPQRRHRMKKIKIKFYRKLLSKKLFKRIFSFYKGNFRAFYRKEECFALLPNVPWVYRISLLKKIFRIGNYQESLPHSYWIAFPNAVWYYRMKIVIKYVKWLGKETIFIPESFISMALFFCALKEIAKTLKKGVF